MAQAILTTSAPVALRVFPVTSDNMEPAHRRGDFAFVVPVDRYQGEGVYAVTDALGGLCLYRFEAAAGGRVRMLSDNPRYARQEVSLNEFEAMVTAKVAVAAAIVDRALMDRVMGGKV